MLILYSISYEWTIVFILLLIVNMFEKMSKCNMYYRPDMGWEPVWYGLWINKAELKENLLKQLKLKGAIPKWTWPFFNTTKMRRNPFGSPPFLPFFRSPHVRLYVQICIQPYTRKARLIINKDRPIQTIRWTYNAVPASITPHG